MPQSHLFVIFVTFHLRASAFALRATADKARYGGQVVAS
jgi:hypothetical protein